ncbi:MAG: hypothetical protein H6765_04740 [Candidatus Peribacteria bacterium]|nr:MAG: hypothetical protein H6765_04740 [Candidatus Peribacteria bacterium]
MDFSPAKIINSVAFKTFGADKLFQYELLHDYAPKTTWLQTMDEIDQFLTQFAEDDMLVLKPRRGSSGQGVIVCRKSNYDPELIDTHRLAQRGYLGQEFLDTSAGIPGITQQTHDLRIITMIDTIVLCHVRTPPSGSLIGNTHT